MTVPDGVPPFREPGEREPLPDQLRGLALLGIVLVNMPFLALSSAGFTTEATPGVADRVTEFVVVAFAQGKFYLLFSFLFGYSLTLMLRGRSAEGIRRYRRRLVGLAVLGLGHAVLFFVGDILLSYAVLGVVLLWLAPRSDRTALRVAGIAFAVGATVLAGLVLAVALAPQPGDAGDFVADPAAADAAFRGSFTNAAMARFEALPGVLVVLGVLNWAYAVAMFGLGLVAGRRGMLARPDAHAGLWARLLRVGLLVGLPAALLAATLSTTAEEGSVRETFGLALGFAIAPLLTAGHVALAARCTRGRVLGFMAPAGRMSLTGYLGESILLSAIFCGWGLGLFGELAAFPSAMIALGVWLVLELGAKAWLARWRFGPFEWLLRAWTYRSWPPMRRPPVPVRAPDAPGRP